MEYKVLYRKYRPSDFKSIVGQDYSISMLQNAIKHNKISHAYLFTGPRGTGKTSTAKVFAKTINCENPIDGEACGKCESCLNFFSSPDIIEIDAASNNGVDDVRELISNVKIAPSMSKYKIYIIDEVHMMTQSAFNALLLTLEEPPAHAVFILATTNVESVPITILSRCQRFNFKKISLEVIEKQIKNICEVEKIKITDEAISEIAYLSEGGMRDALSLLDQLSSKDEEITVDKILKNYGSISSVFIKKLIENIENSNIEEILNSIKELEETSSDYKVFLKKFIKELIKKSVFAKQYPGQSKFNYEQIKNLIFDLNDCFNKMSIHVNPYSIIQVAILNYVNVDNVDNLSVHEQKNEIKDEKESKEVLVEKEKNYNQDDEIKEENKEKDDNNEEAKEDGVIIEEDNMKEYLKNLKQIRVNNCFATAKKQNLVELQTMIKKISPSNQTRLSLIMDASVSAAGDKVSILSCDLESTAELINHHLEEIEKEFNSMFQKNVSFIAISLQEWNKMKQEYIQNIKKGVKYEEIDESKLADIKPMKHSNGSQLKKYASELFGSDKIEVI